MKTKPIIVLLMSISYLCYGQKNSYNDWFDLNLKGTPKSTKEVSLLSFTDYFKPNFSEFFNNSLKCNFFIDEYQFDGQGLISKEFHKTSVDTIGKWIDYSKMKLLKYEDSIIFIDYNNKGDVVFMEKRLLNKNGNLRCKIIDSNCPDTTIFTRDSKNRIVTKYRNWYCIDYGQRKTTVYELNDNGDVIVEKSLKDSNEFEEEGQSNIDIIRYEYTYDSKLNWIVKVTFDNNELISITQREIQY